MLSYASCVKIRPFKSVFIIVYSLLTISLKIENLFNLTENCTRAIILSKDNRNRKDIITSEIVLKNLIDV